MMELMIGVCDDLEEERMALACMVRSYAQKWGKSIRLRLFSSGTELLDACTRPGLFQVLFLDIFMPGLSGMETARKLRAKGIDAAIIFATTSLDHGLDSFSVQAADYLIKPFQAEDVERALDWCLAHLPEPLRCLPVYAEGEEQEIPLASILYIEVLGHRSHIHTADQVDQLDKRGLRHHKEPVDRQAVLIIEYVDEVFTGRTGFLRNLPVSVVHISPWFTFSYPLLQFPDAIGVQPYLLITLGKVGRKQVECLPA